MDAEGWVPAARVPRQRWMPSKCGSGWPSPWQDLQHYLFIRKVLVSIGAPWWRMPQFGSPMCARTAVAMVMSSSAKLLSVEILSVPLRREKCCAYLPTSAVQSVCHGALDLASMKRKSMSMARSGPLSRVKCVPVLKGKSDAPTGHAHHDPVDSRSWNSPLKEAAVQSAWALENPVPMKAVCIGMGRTGS